MAYNLLSDMEVYDLGATAPIRINTKNKNNLISGVSLLEPGHF